MNLCIYRGRLVRDPQVKYTTSNKVVCLFSLAVSREFKNKETGNYDADFIPVVIWGKRGEYFGKTLTKCTPILVHGRTQTRTYQDNESRTIYVSECIASKIELLGKTKPNLADDHTFFTEDLEDPFNDDNYPPLDLRYENEEIPY